MGQFQSSGRVRVREAAAPASRRMRFARLAGRALAYLARHWRGEIGLARALIVNGVALGLLVLLAANWLARPLTGIVDEAVAAFVLTVAWSALALITLWQAVGIWRSADRHAHTIGQAVGPGTARLAVLLGVTITLGAFVRAGLPQIVEASQLAVGVDPLGEATLQVVHEGTEVELSGPIVFGVTHRMRALLEEHPEITTLSLSSPGGRVVEARKLRDVLRAHGITTVVNGNCASACTIVFMAGRERLLVRGSTVGFHRYRSPGLDDAEIEASMRIDRRELAGQGVPDWFLERAFGTPNVEMWRPAIMDLRRAQIVTGELRADGSVLWRDRASLERELLQTALYGTLRTYEPEVYEQVLDAMEQGVQRGLSVQDVGARARPLIARLASKYIPSAADQALVQAATVVTQTMRVLSGQSATECLRYIQRDGEPDSAPADLSRLPEALRRQDLAATAAIIETGATAPPQPPGDAVASDLQTVFSQLTALRADAGAVLDRLAAPDVDPAAACEVVLALYERALALPSPRNAQLLRFLLGA
jgi:hypothetical protein